MARIEKHKDDTLYYIRHNMRELPANRRPSNEEIDEARTKDNYSIISRGNTAEEVNAYRKQIEGDLFHYNRKNLVHSVEVVITLPSDCPAEQEEAFFNESVKYVASTLPMGDKCIFQAEVHKDEGRLQKDGETVVEAPPHLHIMYVPGVPDTKHDNYDYKLCADQLTKRTNLRDFHPNFQTWLDDAGIKATVISGATGGANISVKELKQFTKDTGLTLQDIKGLDIEQLKDLTASQNAEIRQTIFKATLQAKNEQISVLERALADKDETIEKLNDKLINNEHTRIVTNSQEQQLKDKIEELEETLKTKEEALQKALEEKQTVQNKTIPQEQTWGASNSSWGRTEGWGTKEEEKTW